MLRHAPLDDTESRAFARECAISPTLAHILIGRGITKPEQVADYLYPKLSRLSAPDAMADREAATERIVSAISRKEAIVVFGDYDVDGTTSAAILCDVIQALGGNATAMIADRFLGGYGFSDKALERCYAYSPGLIITCDCGSSDHERIAAAQKKGIDVIVVDHHLVPEEPLPAHAFLNPHRPDCAYPYKMLASAGLALVVGAALRQACASKLDLRPWLDLVALGTVADVAPLDGDNRILVRAGLRMLGESGGRPGVRALSELARVPSGQPLTAGDISFSLAPRLNAGGRLGDGDSTLRLLRATTLEEARSCAVIVERHNQRRRKLQEQVTQEAIAQVSQIYGDKPETGIVVSKRGWHRGVVGIVAARLADLYEVPAIVIGVDEGTGHGSGRTPPGYALYDAIAKGQRELVRFGGHQAAAGLSVREERIDAFRDSFSAATSDVGEGDRSIDVDLRLDGVRAPLPTAQELYQLEPLGQGNPSPVFLIEGANVCTKRVVGERHLKLEFEVGDQRMSGFAPFWGGELSHVPKVGAFVGTLRPDRFRGGRAIELLVKGWLRN